VRVCLCACVRVCV